MNYEFKKCLEKRKLIKISIDARMVEREIDSAKYDLDKAKDSFTKRDFKWATVKSYYVIFHCCRALLYSKGYRERSHRCLLIGLRELFKNTLEDNLIKSFEEAMDLREEADYESKFSESSAESVFEDAEEFLEKAKTLISRKS